MQNTTYPNLPSGSLPNSHLHGSFPMVRFFSRVTLGCNTTHMLSQIYYHISKSWHSSLKLNYGLSSIYIIGPRALELMFIKLKLILYLSVSYGYDDEWSMQSLSVKRFIPAFRYISQSIRIFTSFTNTLTLKLITF